MPPIDISFSDLSQVLWRRWAQGMAWNLPQRIAELRAIGHRLDADVDKMSLQTGSISLGTAVSLYLASRKMAATTIFEVGTFIGKSAVAMGLGMHDAGVKDGCIYTCDMSNDFVMSTQDLPFKISAFPRTSSTDAMRRMLDLGKSVDFFHLDGRISNDDIALMDRLSTDQTVIAIDDFEGIEKGTINAAMLKQSSRFASYILVYPPPLALMHDLGVVACSLTALLMPPQSFRLTPQ